MIRKLQARIEKLQSEHQVDFLRQVRQRVGKKASLVLEPRLSDLVLSMPEQLRRLQAHWQSSPDNPAKRRHSDLLYSYVLHPVDLVNEEREGLFGLVDDAYLVSEILLRENPPGLGDFEKRLKKGRDAARKVMPLTCRAIVRLIDGVMVAGDWGPMEKALGGRSVEVAA